MVNFQLEVASLAGCPPRLFSGPAQGPSTTPEGPTHFTAGDAEMVEHAKRATAYRERAEELRTIAPGLQNDTSREIFLRLAENYENLANIQEQLAALNV